MFGKAFNATLGVGCALVVGFFLLLFLAGILSGLFSRSQTATTAPFSAVQAPAATSSAAPRAWVVIKVWEGRGIKQTESFTVGGEWRVDWINSSDSYLGVTIYDAGTNFPIDVASNVTKAGSDTSFEHRAGTFYLSINATGPWKVDVQDLR